MRKNRIAALEDVVPYLAAAELAIDEALLQTTSLTQAMIRARRTAGLAATVGHDAILEAGTTFGTPVDGSDAGDPDPRADISVEEPARLLAVRAA